jgi:hypothetical protein
VAGESMDADTDTASAAEWLSVPAPRAVVVGKRRNMAAAMAATIRKEMERAEVLFMSVDCVAADTAWTS